MVDINILCGKIENLFAMILISVPHIVRKPDIKHMKDHQDKKKEYEKLFGAEGLSLSHGIRMCLDYAALQISAGKLIISDSGIHENILNNLK